MSDATLFKTTYALLEQEVNTLIALIAKQNPAFLGFEIERITKEAEKEALLNGITSIKVKPLNQWQHLYAVLGSWKTFTKDIETYSSKFVDRMPGIIVALENTEQIIQIVSNINNLKDELAFIVRKRRNTQQRHEFIHQQQAWVMTDQLYRHIHLMLDEVTNVWFNWTSRPVPKRMSLQEATDYLSRKKNKPKFLFSNEEWQAIINNAINDVNSGLFSHVQRYKAYRVFPTVEFQINENGQKKTIKKNATIPIILLGQKENCLPRYSLLGDYCNEAHKGSMGPKLGPNKTMICSLFGLVGVKHGQ